MRPQRQGSTAPTALKLGLVSVAAASRGKEQGVRRYCKGTKSWSTSPCPRKRATIISKPDRDRIYSSRIKNQDPACIAQPAGKSSSQMKGFAADCKRRVPVQSTEHSLCLCHHHAFRFASFVPRKSWAPSARIRDHFYHPRPW